MTNVIRYSVAAAILAVGMVVSSVLISRFFVRIEHQKEIKVKGFAESAIVSDIGQLQATVSARHSRRESTYQLLNSYADKIVSKVSESAPTDLSIELGNPRFEAVYKLREDGTRTNEIERYSGSQTVAFASSDVRWIKRTGQELNELIGEGYDIEVHAPTFLVSNLAEIKRELLQKATADGYRRAELIAVNSGAEVGALRAARQGVFQITRPNSTRTSSYGVYDTSTIDKSIRAVVTLEYAIRRG